MDITTTIKKVASLNLIRPYDLFKKNGELPIITKVNAEPTVQGYFINESINKKP